MKIEDSLGDRMKSDYETRTRTLLPRRTYVIVRLDGKSFHTYTRGCERPYDAGLMADMDATAVACCEAMEGARLAYVQSDEISVVLTDFGSPQSEAWFDSNIQKICSISASIATARFNQLRLIRALNNHPGQPAAQIGVALERLAPAHFDSRVFSIPDRAEVLNYFIWRQQDATRNSISMTAQAHFDHAELQGIGTDELQEMLFQERGINWSDQPDGFKRGRCIVKETIREDRSYTDKRTGEEKIAVGVERSRWVVKAPPVFTKERQWLAALIPQFSD